MEPTKTMRLLPNAKDGSHLPRPSYNFEVIQNKVGEQLQWNTALDCWKPYTPEKVRGETGSVLSNEERGVQGTVGPTGDVNTQGIDKELGMRFNSNKVKFGLIPGHWTRVLAQILTVGAKKYAPRNWEKGLVHSEILDSFHRHLDSFLKGERYDPETKCHHLGHVAWNALALMTMDLKGLGKADLPTDDDVKTMED